MLLLLYSPAATGGATYTLAADSGSFALTGQDAGLAFNRTLAADSGSFNLTGQAANLAFNRVLAADSGAFTLSGQAANLLFNRRLSADSGAFSLVGQDAGLAFNRRLAADSGAFALTGQDTGLRFNRVLSADSGSYALTGQPATLTYTPLSGPTYTLIADSGAFALTGQPADLLRGYRLTADGGAYALAGQDVALTYSPAFQIRVHQAGFNTAASPYEIRVYQTAFVTADEYDIKVYQCGFDSTATVLGSDGGRKRSYIRRKGKILIFDTIAQADAYIEAEEIAIAAIAQAKSRGAKKRIAARVLTPLAPAETVDIAPLEKMVQAYSMPVDINHLLQVNDYNRVIEVMAQVRQLQEAEDEELLLLMA